MREMKSFDCRFAVVLAGHAGTAVAVEKVLQTLWFLSGAMGKKAGKKEEKQTRP